MNYYVLIKSKGEHGWIGVDWDGTIVEHPKGDFKEFTPIPRMVSRVKRWLDQGRDVRILTARVSPESFGKKKIKKQKKLIQKACEKYFGYKLPVTAEKDHLMIALYDDRAHHVEKDTGRVVEE